MVRSLGYNYKIIYIDLGEIFLNFLFHSFLRKHSGVHFSHFKKDIESLDPPQSRILGVWNRTWLGLKPCLLWAVTFYYFVEEFVRGKESLADNSLRWDKVILNIIGNSNYNPLLPNVFKWDYALNRIASDIKAYTDDLRPLG